MNRKLKKYFFKKNIYIFIYFLEKKIYIFIYFFFTDPNPKLLNGSVNLKFVTAKKAKMIFTDKMFDV